jgi:hypothetical protein
MNQQNKFHLRFSPELPRKSSIPGFVPEVPNLRAKIISDSETAFSKLDTFPYRSYIFSRAF